MASLQSKISLQVKIPNVEIIEKITHYTISTHLMSYSWEVSHRYSEFAELHEVLVMDHGLPRDLLPPKKIIGNKDPEFVEKRRKDLESYLQKIVNFLSNVIPEKLAEFLELKYYEANFLLQDLAKHFFKTGDLLLQQNDPVEFNPLQLMSISKQMRSPHQSPFCGKDIDFANIVDFCSNVQRLIVQGSSEKYRASNIIMNELPYNFNVFKNIKVLKIYGASVSKIEDLGPVRKSVKSLTVRKCDIKELSDIIVCDSVHHELTESPENAWCELQDLDLSYNVIHNIDKSLMLTRRLMYLNLNSNKLTCVGTFLTKLPQLLHLDLSNNQLCQLDDLHTKFGNIIRLDLSQNNLSNLIGLSKLYSIVSLNLASNSVKKVTDVESVCCLPCLEELNLTGNPVTTSIDYRIKILELFGKRAGEVCLDNERPTQKELDKVAVLQALRTAREGKLPTLKLSHPLPSSPLNLLLEKTDLGTVAKE